MNFKTMLLTTAAATLIAGVANAKDFTGSLFLPSKGEVLSNTSAHYERLKLKHHADATENFIASEQITYGVDDNFSVYGEITNNFDFKGLTNQQYNNDHNFGYEIGAKYNWNYNNILAQVGAGYYTFKPSSWYGHRNDGYDSDWYKQLNFEAQLGYDMGNGFVPYSMFIAETPIDQKDREVDYALFAGVHKTFDRAAVDAGVRYEFNTDDGSNTNEWFLQAEANYFVRDNVALGVFGDYYLGGSYNEAVKYDYTAGVNVKVLF